MKPLYDCVIYGAGDLGTRVAHIWKIRNPTATILCVTRTSQRHEVLGKFGFEVTTSDNINFEGRKLLIAFPPSDTYAAEIGRALDHLTADGQAVHLSSAGIYFQCNGEEVFEDSPISMTGTLFEGEEQSRSRGALIVRLAGLYSDTRGPQCYWQKLGAVQSWADGFVNLIHIDDAAELAASLLGTIAPCSDVFLGCDGSPLTRQQIATAWATAKKLPPCNFLALTGELGKRINPRQTWRLCKTLPHHKDFLSFTRTMRRE